MHSLPQANATVQSDATCPFLTNSFELSGHQKARLSSLLNSFDAMFTDKPDCAGLVRHKIDMGNALPLKCNPRPVSLAKQRAIDAALSELITTGTMIRHCHLCIDYCRVNDVARKDVHSLPSIDSVISTLGKCAPSPHLTPAEVTYKSGWGLVTGADGFCVSPGSFRVFSNAFRPVERSYDIPATID